MYKSERLVGYVDDLIGRGPVYARITEGFQNHKVVVVHGIGGVGKTQVLLGYVRYTELFAPDCRYALSVPAVGDLDNELAALARSRGWVSDAVAEQAVVVAAAWRELGTQGRVLVALDNVDEAKVVTEFRKKLPDASFLVTQRKPSAFPGAVRVKLAVLGREDGALFLFNRANLTPPSIVPYSDDPLRLYDGDSEWEAALLLSDELGGLTLALNLAGAYVLENEITIAGYRKRYDKEAAALLNVTFDADDSYKHSVVAAVLLSLSQTKKRSEAAAQLVQTVAFFADAPVPLFLWEAGKELLPAPLRESVGGGTAWDGVVAEAARFGLVQVDASDGALTMHCLTRRVLQTWEQVNAMWTKETQIKQGLARIVLINTAFGVIARYDWLRYTGLLRLADAVQEWAEKKHQRTIEVARLYYLIAFHIDDKADYKRAMILLKSAIAIMKSKSHHKDPELLMMMNDLAEVYRECGDYDAALSLHEEVLSLRDEIFGTYDSSVAESYNNIALLRHIKGDYVNALALYCCALSIQKKLMPRKYSEIAIIFNNIGLLYKEQGKYQSSLPRLRCALKIRKHIFGLNHHDTIQSINNLGSVYTKIGNFTDGIPLLIQSLAMYIDLFGEKHPGIISNISNIATAYRNAGKYKDAIIQYEKAISLHGKYFNENNSDIAPVLYGMAKCLYLSGDIMSSIDYMRRSSIIYEEIFGLNHPYVVENCQEMVMLLTESGDTLEAQIWKAKVAASQLTQVAIT